MSEERLQKILSRAGVASRRGAEEMLRQGRVTVNGVRATVGDKADPVEDVVKLDGKRLAPPPAVHRYVLLNKPRGCLTTRHDPSGRRTVFDLLPPRLGRGLFAVGRLDYHTEGLLLLTDDGELAQRISHPRFGCVKRYLVKVKGTPDSADLARLRRGVTIGGRRAVPLRVRRSAAPRGQRAARDNSWWQVDLKEGRTRQIREMFFRVGHPVQKLRRIAIGPLSDPHLPSGRYRSLEDAELDRLRSVGLEPPARGPAGRSR